MSAGFSSVAAVARSRTGQSSVTDVQKSLLCPAGAVRAQHSCESTSSESSLPRTEFFGSATCAFFHSGRKLLFRKLGMKQGQDLKRSDDVGPVSSEYGSSFGKIFSITTFGESHGAGIGVIVDGCPPELPITVEEIQAELNRRKPGQSKLTTPRKEDDTVEILSGVVDGVTTGAPIAMLVRNKDQRSGDYSDMELKYRPSHADATYDMKYGLRSVAGGGRSSARETIGRVAAAAIAKKILKVVSGVEIIAYVKSVKDVVATVDPSKVTLDEVESNIVRCPDAAAAERMIAVIDEVRTRGNSIGGTVECVARGVPPGLGSPVFDKLEADLAKACMSLPATKGFEVGSGFAGTLLTGEEHNDEFYLDESGKLRTVSNRSGGIQGGISNGEDIVVRLAFKPTSTIGIEQNTVTADGHETTLRAKGRHDPCVTPRAVPMVEAMVALTLVDHLMQHHAQCHLLNNLTYQTSPRPYPGRKESVMQQS